MIDLINKIKYKGKNTFIISSYYEQRKELRNPRASLNKDEKNNIMVIYLLISAFLAVVFTGLRLHSYVNSLRTYRYLLSKSEEFFCSENDQDTASTDFKKELEKTYRQNYKKCVKQTKYFFWVPVPIVFALFVTTNIISQPALKWNNIIFYWELVVACILAIPEVYYLLSYFSTSKAFIRNDLALMLSMMITLIVLLGYILGILLSYSA